MVEDKLQCPNTTNNRKRFSRFIILYVEKDKCWSFDAIANAFYQCFLSLGYEAYVHCIVQSSENLLPFKLRETDCLFCICWDVFKFPRPHSWRRAGGVIMYNLIELSENFGKAFEYWHKRFKTFFKNLSRLQLDFIAVFNYVPTATHILRKKKIRDIWCPFGYHESFESKLAKKIEQKNDCAFLGTMSKENGLYRVNLIEKLSKNFSVVAKTFHGHPNAIRDLFSCRTWMNIHRELKMINFRDISTFRWAVPNKRVVVNELSTWQPPFGQWIHWVSVKSEEFPSVIKFLLERDKLRLQMAANALEFSKKYWNLRDHLKRALAEIEN